MVTTAMVDFVRLCYLRYLSIKTADKYRLTKFLENKPISSEAVGDFRFSVVTIVDFELVALDPFLT
jgi:hypothetical protein